MATSPQDITGADQHQLSNNNLCLSPIKPSSNLLFQIPSPIPTRRTRTYSACERAADGPTYTGKVKYFCRQKGHGFINPDSGGGQIFVHISDIEGEFVPVEGDDVTYKLLLIPPKNELMQAVHVHITNLDPEIKHERWDSPITHSPASSPLAQSPTIIPD